MRDYFCNIIDQFGCKLGNRVYAQGNQSSYPVYDYIFLQDNSYVDSYYEHLAEGGVIAGLGFTDYFGNDITKIGSCWMHTKRQWRDDFPYKPYIITLDRKK